MTTLKNKFTFIDLFSGCGGLSEGFLSSGNYEGLAHVEWELPMVETLRNRLEKKWKHSKFEALKRVIHYDIQKTTELLTGNFEDGKSNLYAKSNEKSLIEKGIDGIVGKKKIDVIIGGPPCTSYSLAGRAKNKHNMENDYRNFLFESFVKVVNHYKPKIFVFENVPGLLSAAPGDKLVTERIYEAFKEIGYEIRNPIDMKKSIYNAKHLGVPQDRRRVIIFGVKNDEGIELENLYKELDKKLDKNNIKTVSDAIKHLPPIKPLRKFEVSGNKKISHKIESQDQIKYHEPRFHNERDIKIFKEWITRNLNKRTTIEKIEFYKKMVGKESKHAKYRNIDWSKPSPTIVSHLSKDGLMFIHPDEKQARSITVLEAALIQSFPKDYEFLGSQGIMYKMIGNAVPPKMAKNIANAILKELK
jgi:DNA (cytosine-5)-methyltransferase 1